MMQGVVRWFVVRCWVVPDDTEYCGGCWVVNDIAGACNFHMWALRHNRRFLPRDVANTIDCSIVGT